MRRAANIPARRMGVCSLIWRGVRSRACGRYAFVAWACAGIFSMSLTGQTSGVPGVNGIKHEPASAQESSQDFVNAVPLDRVIAVVNNQVILASDLDLEMRFDRLLPINNREESSPTKTLQRLITRALIQQQILQEDPHGLEVDSNEVDAEISEARQNLPSCKSRDCNTPAGWSAYLRTMGLTPESVRVYWSNRMALLRFIEQRFRTGIRITPEEIDKYYKETLLPQYANADDAPGVQKISPRIQEILLQQRVTVLFNDWLKSLKEQGQVEVLDSSLQAASEFDDKQPNKPSQTPATPGIPINPSAPATGSGPALTPVPTQPSPTGPHSAEQDATGGHRD
jgi:peptidyl-prolyl cis-trans isomerase SurA